MKTIMTLKNTTALGLLLLAGCSGGEIPLAGTTDDANKVVSSALDAWKEGKKPDVLQSEKPSIRVVDLDWSGGKGLKSYNFPNPPVRNGGHWRVSAVLTLASAGGRDTQRTVAYAVTLDPSVSIIRADDVIE